MSEILYANYTRRKSDLTAFGQGFDTPRLHQIITTIVIQCKPTDFSGFYCFLGEFEVMKKELGDIQIDSQLE